MRSYLTILIFTFAACSDATKTVAPTVPTVEVVMDTAERNVIPIVLQPFMPNHQTLQPGLAIYSDSIWFYVPDDYDPGASEYTIVWDSPAVTVTSSAMNKFWEVNRKDGTLGAAYCVMYIYFRVNSLDMAKITLIVPKSLNRSKSVSFYVGPNVQAQPDHFHE